MDRTRSELMVERMPPTWYSTGISTPSTLTRVSCGANPHTISAPQPKAERPTPGRIRTTLSVSPWVPGTRLASSVRTRVSTTSFLIRGARTTASSSTSASFASTMYLTDFFLPLLITSSVLTVTSSRDDSSMVCGPGGTSVKAKAPSWSVAASTP